MGIEFGKNDFEDDSIVLGADRDHAIDYPDPVASRAEQALIDSLPREKRRQRFHSLRERPEGNEYTISGMGNLVADVTPVISDIKAAYELPNDLSYAFELVERGYEEGDLKKMGLGGAFATLSAMGIIPGVRIGAKAGKEAIKASIKAPEGLNIKAAKEVATTGELTNAMQQLAKTQDNEITNNQISEILNKGKPNWTSADLEDSFSTMSVKNINVVDSLKSSSQYKGQTLTPEEKDALSSAFDDLEQTITPEEKESQALYQALIKAKDDTPEPKKDIFGLTPKVQNDLVDDLKMLGNAQNEIVTNKQIQDIVEIKTGFTPNVETTNEIETMLNSKGISTINNFGEFEKLTGQKVNKVDIVDLETSKISVKKEGIENFDEITKILNDQDKGMTSPSAVKALAGKQNNEVSKQQLFYILEHYKDAPINDADYKSTMKYFQNTEGVKIVDDVSSIKNPMSNSTVNNIEKLAFKQNNEITKKQLSDISEQEFKATPGLLLDEERDQLYGLLNMQGIKVVDKVSGKEAPPQVIGGTFAKMDVDMTPDQKFLVDKIRSKKAQLRGFIDQQSLTTPYLSNKGLKDMPFTENQKDLIDRINIIDFTGKKFDMRNRADQIEIAKLLPKPIRRAMIQELNRPVPKIFHGSAGISQPYEGYKGTVYRDTTRAEVLEAEGFSPFTDFEEGVELGIGGSKGASGMHAELGKKMLSTSRDPLVSIKRSFGDLVPANVVSAPFPRGKVRGMTREEYTASKDKSQYSRDDTAAGLPRTRHKEAEIAFSTPEELKNIRQLSLSTDRLEDSVDRDKLKNLGKMSLEDRVRTGQRFATGVSDKIKNFYTRMNTDVAAYLDASGKVAFEKSSGRKAIQYAYEDLRNVLKDMQALGQFTEQYGARGTYDSLLETLFKDTDRTVDKLSRLLPKGEKKENVEMLSSVFEIMKDKRFVLDTGKPSLRGVSDKKLKEMLKSDKPIGANYEDLKRMVFLLTDKFNRGGLMTRR